MISLAYLRNRGTVEKIIKKNPKLIYYMCHKENQNQFPLYPILDVQEDCKELKRFNITKYKAPWERSTHTITRQSCEFTKFGQEVAAELIEKKICLELLTLFQEREVRNNQELFIRKFHEKFSFAKDQTRIIEQKLRELEKRLFINLPDRNYTFRKERNKFTIDYDIIDEDLFAKIKVDCECSNEFEHHENLNEYEAEGIKIHCERCTNLFTISSNLYFCSDIIRNFQLDE